MAEEMETTDVLTPEADTQLDTAEPTTDQLISDDISEAFDKAQAAKQAEEQEVDADEVSDEAKATEDVDDSSVSDEDEKPKVVLTRKEKEALKHAGMEEVAEGMEPSAMKALAKKLASERSEKDKLASKAGELEKKLKEQELAEQDQFDVDSEENEWLPDEAKEAFKAKDAQMKALQDRLEALEQGSDHTVERFWDKIDKTQYSQYVDGDDAAELRGEIEGDANAYMASRPGITRAEALSKCLEIANHDQIVKAEVAKEVAKRLRKKRGGPTPVHTGGQRLPSTGTQTLKEHLGDLYDKSHGA